MLLLVLISFKLLALSEAYFLVNITETNNIYTAVSKDLNETVPLNGSYFCILVHGWQQNAGVDLIQSISAKLEEKNRILLLVDFGKIASNLAYFPINTAEIGLCLSRFLQPIFSKSQPSYIHGVGFSLGAHVLGAACRELNKTSKCNCTKITGLDPAGPNFEEGKTRLNKTDADIVVHWETNGGIMGNKNNLGSCHIKVNDGRSQPGCPFGENNLMKTLTCSHVRVMKIFLESIGELSKRFIAYNETGGALVVNDDISVECIGNYTLKTKSTSPYALG